jgi:hypothetical protein
MQIPKGLVPVAMVLVPDKAPVEVFRLKIETVVPPKLVA